MLSLKQYLSHATSLCIALSATAVFAGVGSPKSALVEHREVSIEYKGERTGDDNAARNNAQEHEFEVYYGVSDHVKLGFERVYENEPRSGFESASYVPNATLETTQQGDWWLSSGVYGQYKFKDGGNDSMKVVFIGERTEGDFFLRGNLGFVRNVGAGRKHGLYYESALQGLYTYNDYLKPGVEWFADYGTINDTKDGEDQEHYVGPVLTGKLFNIGNGYVKYAAGYYWGATDASADNAQRVKIEYEFTF